MTRRQLFPALAVAFMAPILKKLPKLVSENPAMVIDGDLHVTGEVVQGTRHKNLEAFVTMYPTDPKKYGILVKGHGRM